MATPILKKRSIYETFKKIVIFLLNDLCKKDAERVYTELIQYTCLSMYMV